MTSASNNSSDEFKLAYATHVLDDSDGPSLTEGLSSIAQHQQAAAQADTVPPGLGTPDPSGASADNPAKTKGSYTFVDENGIQQTVAYELGDDEQIPQ